MGRLADQLELPGDRRRLPEPDQRGARRNWLGGNEVGPGEAMTLEFVKDGPCDIEVRVGWRTTDGGQEMGEPWQINICDAHTVYFDGEQVTYD